MYANKQKQSDFFNKQKHRPYLPVKSKINSVSMSSPRIQQKSSDLSRDGGCDFPRFSIKQNAVIQKCSESSDEEEEKPYNDILQLYDQNIHDKIDEFKAWMDSFDEALYDSIRYVIKNAPGLMEDPVIYRTLGLIKECSIGFVE